MKAKKSSGKPAAKRAKDLPPRKTSGVKGGGSNGTGIVAGGWDLKTNRKVG